MDKKKFNDYEGFVEKFKPKLTTDDCYTPPLVYNAVLSWAKREYSIPEGAEILRPFKPGGDYQSIEYGESCFVIDNPPFSILAKIVRWYQKRGIKFFLFAPALTLFSSFKPGDGVTAISGAGITYENGAKVATGFLTNMSPAVLARTAPDLTSAIESADDFAQRAARKATAKIEWPDNVLTAARLNTIRRAPFEAEVGEAVRVTRLDLADRDLYGGAYLLSKAKAKAKAEAEAKAKAEAEAKAEVYKLSAREQRIIEQLRPIEEGFCPGTKAS